MSKKKTAGPLEAGGRVRASTRAAEGPLHHASLHTPGLPARLAGFRSVVCAATKTMLEGTLASEALGRQGVPFLHTGVRLDSAGSDTRLIQQALNLGFHPGARVWRHGAKRAPLRFRAIDRDEPAGVLVHCTSRRE